MPFDEIVKDPRWAAICPECRVSQLYHDPAVAQSEFPTGLPEHLTECVNYGRVEWDQ